MYQQIFYHALRTRGTDGPGTDHLRHERDAVHVAVSVERRRGSRVRSAAAHVTWPQTHCPSLTPKLPPSQYGTSPRSLQEGTAAMSAGSDYVSAQASRRRAATGRAMTEETSDEMSATTTEMGLEQHGIEPSGEVLRNPTTSQLYADALRRGDGRLAEGGPLVVDTGTLHRPLAEGQVRRARAGLRGSDLVGRHQPADRRGAASTGSGRRSSTTSRGQQRLYVIDAFAGADPAHRIGVRVVTASPYHALFAKTMFIRPTDGRARRARAARRSCSTRPRSRPTRRPTARAPASSSCCTRRRTEVVIGGTFYAGEIKKSIFTVMNDRLPLEGVFPMHCSANVGPDGDVAVFFGLSGTGKTTLSADPARSLIGDDEHGWGDERRLQRRGRLLREGDPPLGRGRARHLPHDAHVRDDPRERRRSTSAASSTSTTTRRPRTRAPRTSSSRSRTRIPSKMAGHPRNVVFLTADAFGILPPIARLTREQAQYWFLSGFTAKLAGTEIGVTEPQPTFSTCFGAAVRPAAPARLRGDARRQARRARVERLAREHGVDGRPVRRGPPDADHGDARAPRGRAVGERSTRRRVPRRPRLRLRGARRRPGRRRRAARPALDVGRPGRIRREGARARGRCSARTSSGASPPTSTPPSRPPARGARERPPAPPGRHRRRLRGGGALLPRRARAPRARRVLRRARPRDDPRRRAGDAGADRLRRTRRSSTR